MHTIKTHGKGVGRRDGLPDALRHRWQQGLTDDLRQAIAGMHFGIVAEEARWAASSRSAVLHEDDALGVGVDALYLAIGRYDPSMETSFRAFARAVVRSRISSKSQQRRHELSRHVSLSSPASRDEGDGEEYGATLADTRFQTVDGDAEWAETFDRITASLSRWQRALVRLHVIEGLQFNEIGPTFGLSDREVGAQVAAAIDAIAAAFTVDELHELLGRPAGKAVA